MPVAIAAATLIEKPGQGAQSFIADDGSEQHSRLVGWLSRNTGKPSDEFRARYALLFNSSNGCWDGPWSAELAIFTDSGSLVLFEDASGKLHWVRSDRSGIRRWPGNPVSGVLYAALTRTWRFSPAASRLDIVTVLSCPQF